MPYLSNPAASAVDHAEQRPGGALELDDLAGQLVDAPGDARVAAEHLGLDLVDVVLQPGDDRGVAVDDRVEDRVQHRLGPAARAAPGRPPCRLAHGGQVGRLAVPDGDHEVGADEHVQLAERRPPRRRRGSGRRAARRTACRRSARAWAAGAATMASSTASSCSSNSSAAASSCASAGRYRPIQAIGAGVLRQTPIGVGERGWPVDAPTLAIDPGLDHALLDRRRGTARAARGRSTAPAAARHERLCRFAAASSGAPAYARYRSWLPP